MARTNRLRTNYTLFKNPSENNYLAAEELRPDCLYADELMVWDRMGPLLHSLGRLQPWYVDTFCQYCRTIVRLNKLSRHNRENGETYKVDTRNGEQIKCHPQAGQEHEQRRALNMYINHFGLSPAAEQHFTDNQTDMFTDFSLIAAAASAGE